jgi:uncharacterized protein YjiS (DUF1127 family)
MHFPRQWSANAIATPTKVCFYLAPIKLKGCGRWISLIAAIVAELWFRLARQREIRRMRKAWATIGNRTLRDIGVSRWEVAHVEFGKPRAADMNVVPLCDRKMGASFSRPGVAITSRIS